MGKDNKPVYDVVGNPNLVYESKLNQPEGLKVSFLFPVPVFMAHG